MHEDTYKYMSRLVHIRSYLDICLDFEPFKLNFGTYIGFSQKILTLQHFAISRFYKVFDRKHLLYFLSKWP